MANLPKKEWTIMFYFASDNPLAPIVVSQLKAITSAGFHQDVNVVCQFDPHTEGTDTHVFDVNRVNKLLQAQKAVKDKERDENRTLTDDEKADLTRPLYKFWGKNDPFIRNLVFDKLWGSEVKFPTGKKIRQSLVDIFRGEYHGLVYDPPDPDAFVAKKEAMLAKNAAAIKIDDKKAVDGDDSSNGEAPGTEPGPMESLTNFLEFCADAYPAEHYMLFFLGHGLIVGNDMFLHDDHAKESSLSLKNLAKVLDAFTHLENGKKLDLIGFHSCSMSAVEVAFELRETATYMLASQGRAFVGSWPYREILFRVFNDLIKTKRGDLNPPTLQCSVEKIFEYVLRYSYDFQLAGYSFELCLCDLREVDQITVPLRELSMSLKKSLEDKDPFTKEAILLAHWDAQSFWQESYTDLYDFCKCLKFRCRTMAQSCGEYAVRLNAIAEMCANVIGVLENNIDKGGSEGRHKTGGKGPIVRATFAGPQSQYSHGLSVYFPWSEPTNRLFWNTDNGEYNTRYEFKDTGWAEFLQTYFRETRRRPVYKEIFDEFGQGAVPKVTAEQQILEEITCKVFNESGPLNTLAGPGKGGASGGLGTGDSKGGPGGGLEKGGGGGGTGGDCDCPSFKNYPTFMHDRPGGVYDQDAPTSGGRELFTVLLPKKAS